MLGETDSRVEDILALMVCVVSVVTRAVRVAVVGCLILKGWTLSVFV